MRTTAADPPLPATPAGWRAAVFLDCDALLAPAMLASPAPQRLAAGTESGLEQLADAALPLIVVSQGAVARDGALIDWLHAVCAWHGAPLAGFYGCAHIAAHGCDCHRPRPGLLWQAARDLRVDLMRSWLVGETLDDIEAGRRAGCHTILLDNGHERRWNLSPIRTPHDVAATLAAAAARVLAAQAAPDDDFAASPAW